MKFIDFFAGIGGFRCGMELAGHECVGFCEIDKYANISYRSMHLINDEQREYLKTLPFKERQKEIQKEVYLNGEWFADDICRVRAEDLPNADCFCFGFPCQSFSIAGMRKGFRDIRGTLFFEVMRLAEIRKPKVLFAENVAGLLNHDGGDTFGTIIRTMDAMGYDVEWQVLNSKFHGVPQNRERVFIIGHLRNTGAAKVFPFEGTNKEYNVCRLNQIGQLYGTAAEPNPMGGRIYETDGLSPTVDTCQGGNRMPKIATIAAMRGRNEEQCGIGENQQKIEISARRFSNSLTTVQKDNLCAFWYPEKECYVEIRKLTPRECFRLQGWEDEYFERARFVNSDSQLYKQAGNGVTVNVIYEIAKRLKE